MQPLFRFLLKYFNTFLFLLLESIAIILIVNNNYYQKSMFINASNSFSGNVYKVYDNIVDYFLLKKTNRILAEENAKLLSKQKSSFFITEKNVFVVNDTFYKQEYSYISAKVISNTVNRANNYVILNKGHKNGINKNMGVISSQGVIGIIKDVSENFCSVYSILHSKSKISVKLKKGNNVGTLIWRGNDYKILTMKDVPTHVKISIGDTVITSGYSLIFPEGVLVGSVYSYDINKGKDFYEIRVKLFNDINSTSYVYVIKNLMREELTKLESKLENE